MSTSEPATFWEHLDVLRGCLIKVVAAVMVCAVAAFFFKDALFEVILAPKDSDFIAYKLFSTVGQWLTGTGVDDFSVSLVNTGLANQFAIHVKTSLCVGMIAASPYVVYVLLGFIAPALYASERSVVYGIVGSGYLMFFVGMAVNYLLIFPLTFRFLGTYQVSGDVMNMITLDSYMDTLLMMSLMLGVLFELPVACWLLGRMGMLSSSFMRHYRRHAIVAILMASAVITPTSDVFTLLLVSMPIWALYEVSILLVPRSTVTAEES